MQKAILIALAVLGAVIFLGFMSHQPTPPPAPQGKLIESGRFVVEQAGKQVADEHYTLFLTPEKRYMLISQETLSVNGKRAILSQQYEFDRDFAPDSYRLKADTPSGQQSITAKMETNGLRMEVRAGAVQQQADVTGKNIAILDNNLVSHYAVLLLGVQEGAIPSRFTAAVPQDLLSLPAVVDGPQQVTFTSGNKSYQGKRYDVHLGDLGIVMITYQGKLAGLINDAQRVHAYNAQGFPEGLTLSSAAAPTTTSKGIKEKEVTFASGDITLAGTLTLPADLAAPVPGVLLIGGSGPVDRDENAPGFKTDVLHQLASALAKAGIASLRYDKRGVGKSGGDFTTASMEDLVADARAALATLEGASGIDREQIFLLGHSEGGILAPIIAAENPDPKGLILLAAPAHSLDWIIRGQIERLNRDMGKSTDEVTQALAQEDQYLDFVRTSHGEWSDYTFDQLKEAMPWLTQAKYDQLREVSLAWLRQHFHHDPIETIKRVPCPVLIVQGEKDYQVPKGEADLLAAALKEAGNPDVTVDLIPDLNHLMRHHPEKPNLTYRHLDEPVDQRVIDAVTEWITSHAAK